MYSFDYLKRIYEKIKENDIEYFNNIYYKNLNKNLKNIIIYEDLNENNILFESIIINNIDNKIEKKIKNIYIICPLIFIISFILSFKQFINMI